MILTCVVLKITLSSLIFLILLHYDISQRKKASFINFDQQVFKLHRPRSIVLKMACSASFFSRNGIFLSQQFSRNSVFQPVSAKFQTIFHPEPCFSLTNSSSIPPNHPDSSRIQTSIVS